MYLVDNSIFVDKSSYYVDVVYLRYFIDFKWVHEYNQETIYLVYLYTKLGETCLWKTRHMTSINTLFTLIYFHLYCC